MKTCQGEKKAMKSQDKKYMKDKKLQQSIF